MTHATIRRWWLAVTMLVAMAATAQITPEAWRAALGAKAAELRAKDAAAVAGPDGTYFLTSELRAYAQGPFWGEDAARACVATKNADPLPAILDLQRQCRKSGVQLILVPVPGKVAVYPEKLDPALAADMRMDAAHQAFYELLRAEGITVIDLLPDLLAMRAAGTLAHCRQDSHWAPAAVERAAARVAEAIRPQPWYAAQAKRTATTVADTATTTGDLAALLGTPDAPKEALALTKVRLDGAPVAGDPVSPVILMGDSHTLVYHQPIAGGIQANGAGLADHLAKELGFAPDLVGVLGSGANASRITLARRKDNLAGKAAIVWCFTAREFTEAMQGWMLVPIVR